MSDAMMVLLTVIVVLVWVMGVAFGALLWRHKHEPEVWVDAEDVTWPDTRWNGPRPSTRTSNLNLISGNRISQ